jgi:hypothetical protein
MREKRLNYLLKTLFCSNHLLCVIAKYTKVSEQQENDYEKQTSIRECLTID